MTSPLDPRLTFEGFVVGPSNRLAAAAARRAAESPGTSYNPLVVYGGPGMGKTHLLTAVGHLASAVRPELRVAYRDYGDGRRDDVPRERGLVPEGLEPQGDVLGGASEEAVGTGVGGRY